MKGQELRYDQERNLITIKEPIEPLTEEHKQMYQKQHDPMQNRINLYVN